ncbi:ClpXP protease specificity-enhancing factor [Saccharospirillum salsuginis]|uniref:Stringent starvation protein B n=1 Tax=Saccharospirillum salsuginis TaxID=418750 RepID=A0A918NCU1_9GAMM|nr:ClpXP protease specificity-enhancing factor [Saccharospirillum salsuginis]GGX58819.1 stringent starvation protein B [Saccharospirillum salsuginis]
MSEMTPNKPYMVRAIHEWILDNDCTPYLVIAADFPGVEVPQQFVRDGQITLNISPGAVRELNLDNRWVEFSARFGGVPTLVRAPMSAIMAIFAKENGQGMGFDVETPTDPPPDGDGPDTPNGEGDAPKKPSLRVVK